MVDIRTRGAGEARHVNWRAGTTSSLAGGIGPLEKGALAFASIPMSDQDDKAESHGRNRAATTARGQLLREQLKAKRSTDKKASAKNLFDTILKSADKPAEPETEDERLAREEEERQKAAEEAERHRPEAEEAELKRKPAEAKQRAEDETRKAEAHRKKEEAERRKREQAAQDEEDAKVRPLVLRACALSTKL